MRAPSTRRHRRRGVGDRDTSVAPASPPSERPPPCPQLALAQPAARAIRRRIGRRIAALSRPGYPAAVPAFLVKTEPSQYSFSDLVRDHLTTWDGISNPLALIHLRAMRRGDAVAVYHSGGEKSVVGIAEVARDPYPDPKLGNPKRVVVDLVPLRALPQPVSLAEFREDEILRTSDLVRLTRLSVMPLTDAQLRRLLALASSPAKSAR